MKYCTELTGCRRKGAGVLMQTDGVPFQIYFLTPDIVRIRAGFTGDFREESYALMLTGWDDRMDDLFRGERERIVPRTPEMRETENEVELSVTNGVRLVLDKKPFRICAYDRDGTLFARDLTEIGWTEDNNLRRRHCAEILPGDRFYGFGETTGPVEKTGQHMEQAPNDTMGYDAEKSDPLYKHIPFYLKLNAETGKSCGFYYHTPWRCAFDVGRAHSNYWPHRISFTAEGGDLDLFLIAGPSMAEVLDRFTRLTGRPAMLPKAALGYLASSMYYPELPKDCDSAILHFLDTAKEEGIPVSGFQLSSGYCEEHGKRYVFTWNDEKFSDPEGYFSACNDRKIVNSANVKPGFLLTHPNYSAFQKWFISKAGEPSIGKWWGGDGAYFDFTNPEARDVWKAVLKEQLLDKGCPSIWNDNCEYEGLFDDDAEVNFEGHPVKISQERTQMALLMCQTTKEAMLEYNASLRPYIVCRSGSEGIQRYAQTWSGDNRTAWETLQHNIATMLGMSLSGNPNYGCDVGGFYGPAPSPELLVRWVQNGIFMPRFSIHSTNTDNTVTEPWMYPSITPIIRDAIQLRYRLLPYSYSLMRQAHLSGAPILRPVFYEYPQDRGGYENGSDFFFGDALLVCNVLEPGQTARKIRFPAGNAFYDLTDGTRYEGGTTVDYPVSLSSIPLFQADGTVLPYEEEHVLHLLIAPGKDASFALYEDDGETNAYLDGAFRETQFAVSRKGEDRVTISASVQGSYAGSYEAEQLEVRSPNRSPLEVLLGEERLPQYLYKKEFLRAEKGWYYDLEKQTAMVRFPCPQGDYRITLSFSQKDLLGM